MREPIPLAVDLRLRRRALLTVIAAALLLLLAPMAPAACKLKQLAELKTSPDWQPHIPVTINGHAASMLVDTGAGSSMIWRSAAQALNLSIAPVAGEMYGVGGSDSLGVVHVKDLALGGFVVHNINMLAGGRLGSEQNLGILGEDFLSHFDIELDLGKNVMRLFKAEDCKGDQVVYWANAYSVVDLVRPADPGPSAMDISSPRFIVDPGWVIAHVSLNGQDALAMFDTGATLSVVTSTFIRSRRIQSDTVPIDEAPGRGIAGKAVPTEVATFSVLSIGQENLQNARLRVTDLWGGTKQVDTGSMVARVAVAPADMLIGSDFFRAHRVYISRSQKKMYFTYQGGPVFVLTPMRASAASSPPANTAAQETAPAETPKN
jgi:predicted aspartyl protease